MSYKVDRSIAERSLGYFPISIGTAFALQSLLGYPVELASDLKGPFNQVANPPYKKYSTILINVRTIIRNMVNSIDAKEIGSIKGDELALSISGEMNYCLQLLRSQTNGALDCVFYDVDYSGLDRKYPNAWFKEATTDKQIHYRELELSCLRELHLIPMGYDYRHYHREISDDFNKSIILTHVPLDLLSQRNYNQLVLLESHTGKLKTKNTWYTKLHAGTKDDLINIPFCNFSIQVFGDGILFSPRPIPIRKHVIEIADKGKWIYSTSQEKMRSDINRYTYDPLLVNDLVQLL